MQETELNKDYQQRDFLLTGKKQAVARQFYRFKNVTRGTLQKLFDQHFIDPDITQNNAPTAHEFQEFLNEFPNFTVHGYATGIERSDYGIVIEGVKHNEKEITRDELIEFCKISQGADELDPEKGYCWYS